MLDPDVWRSAVYLGPADEPPTFNEQSGRVSNVSAETSVVEDTWSAVELEAGRYWLWVSNGWDVAVRSCEPGGVSRMQQSFDRETLIQYLAALGIRADDVGFYGTDRSVRQEVTWPTRKVTVDGARRALGVER